MSRPFAPALALLPLLAGGLLAQEPDHPRPAEPAAVFPADANIVWIDVAAVDSEDRPVATLGREDFEVVEGGKRLPILLFRAPEPESGTRVVVLVEDILARAPHIEHARAAVRHLASGAVAGDRILVVAPASGVSASAVVPAGVPELGAQLDRIRAHPERVSTLTEPGEIRRLHAWRVEGIANALVTLQGHAGSRALIVVGPSLPYRVDGPVGTSAYERVMRASQRAATPIYVFSCGEDPLSRLRPGPDWPGGTGGVAGAVPLFPTTRGGSIGARSLVFDAVAVDSGGFTTPNPAGWESALDRIMRRSRASYLLGIPSVPATWDGRYHRIEVRVLRSGVRVHVRSGYFAPAAAAAPEK
jgi:VWFA-related protein